MPGEQPIDALMRAALDEATRMRASAVEPVHMLLALLSSPTPALNAALTENGAAPKSLGVALGAAAGAGGTSPQPVRISLRIQRALARAHQLSRGAHPRHLPNFIAIALLEKPDATVKAALDAGSIPVQRVLGALRLSVALSPWDDSLHRPGVRPKQGVKAKPGARPAPRRPVAGRRPPARPATPGHPPTPLLNKVGKDYTALARAGKLGPIIGRKEEIKQVVRCLLRKEKNNPVLVGDAGVGKTCIVEGFALRAAEKDAPREVARFRVVELVLSALLGGTKYRGDLEARLQKLLAEVSTDPQLVLFIDEIHMLVGGGKAENTADLANLLKPALARGNVKLVGATTTGEYNKFIETDPALERRFQPIRVEEPTPAEAREVLAGVRKSYENHHGVTIADEALDAAVDLSVRYVPDRRLPDKACDLLDQAAVNRRFVTFSKQAGRSTAKPSIGREDVAEVVSQWTGVPVGRLTTDDRQHVAQLEDALRQRVMGQDHAITAVADVVRTAMAGLANPDRPHGVFLFLGPTGVGKTELAKALAETVYDDEKRLLRYDMSEFMEEHAVEKLIGSPPGYRDHDEGGRLANEVRRNPYSVVLLDEVEKAHPKVLDVFLQVFDEGRLTDGRGRTADFRNAIIIMTSNLGHKVEESKGRIGFAPRTGDDAAGAPADAATRVPMEAVAGFFRPELLNRVSRIVRFEPLDVTTVRAIIDKFIGRVKRRLGEKHIELRVEEASYDVLLELGYSPEFGAREMERVIERHIVQPIARGILDGTYADGTSLKVAVEGGKIALRSP